jgi:Xaa-Pro aminopeptidase
MFHKDTYLKRRNQLAKDLGSGLILMLGNEYVGMNYAANTYPFRQDSNFLYFFGLDKASLAAVIDIDNGNTVLFGHNPTVDDIVWEGQVPSINALASSCGVIKTEDPTKLADYIHKANNAGQHIHYLPPYRNANVIRLSSLLDKTIDEVKQGYSVPMIHAVASQRSIKSAEEITEMTEAVNITRAMHIAVMKGAKQGVSEAELAGLAQHIAYSQGKGLAYPVILSKDGQTLHNHYHGNILQEGQLVLGDFGAQNKMYYAGDITRTCSVSAKFTEVQKSIYEIVLKAEMDSISACKAGVKYKDVHLKASKIIATGLKDLGLMKGDVDEAVANGAHALFFPHGLGHHIGLDVHDMEDLGEQYIGYDEETKRSDQFGTKYLRLGKKLEAGNVITVEPGIYFIPELIDKWKGEGMHTDFINYSALESFRQFGGIRIEDNILITESGSQILGDAIPKSIEEIEAL